MADLGSFKNWGDTASLKPRKGDTIKVGTASFVYNGREWAPSATPTATSKPISPTIPSTSGGLTIAPMPGATTTVGGSSDWWKTYPATLELADKIRLQEQMLAVGAYGNTKLNPIRGIWNPELDGKAFEKIVDIANSNPKMFAPDPKTRQPNYQAVLDFGLSDPKSFSGMIAVQPSSSGGYSGPTTSIGISKTKYNSQNLKDTVNTVYRQALGREASADEINQAVKAVNSGKAGKTTTVTSVNKKGQTVTQSTTVPGVDPNMMIEDQAKANPEYGSYQAATTYFDAMLSALNGPVGQGA